MVPAVVNEWIQRCPSLIPALLCSFLLTYFSRDDRSDLSGLLGEQLIQGSCQWSRSSLWWFPSNTMLANTSVRELT